MPVTVSVTAAGADNKAFFGIQQRMPGGRDARFNPRLRNRHCRIACCVQQLGNVAAFFGKLLLRLPADYPACH